MRKKGKEGWMNRGDKIGAKKKKKSGGREWEVGNENRKKIIMRKKIGKEEFFFSFKYVNEMRTI